MSMSGVRVRIPAPLRSVTEGESELSVDGGNVGQVLTALESRFPQMRQRLRDDEGSLRRFVNLYLNGEDVRFLKGLDTDVKAGDEVAIIPAVAGG
jgi:molybdopterin synthase sulfur carrier subunit